MRLGSTSSPCPRKSVLEARLAAAAVQRKINRLRYFERRFLSWDPHGLAGRDSVGLTFRLPRLALPASLDRLLGREGA